MLLFVVGLVLSAGCIGGHISAGTASGNGAVTVEMDLEGHKTYTKAIIDYTTSSM